MRVALVVLSLAACGFHTHDVAGDAPRGGGDAGDAAIDAPDAPPADTDADGIVDATDNCPTVANADQRDWDADGHGDVCDHCPHLASAADPDGDGDGVGDACDPRPTTAGDHRALWAGFYDGSDIAGWTTSGSWSVTGGELVQASASTSQTAIYPPTTYQHAYVATELEVGSFGTGGTNGIGACSGNVGGSQYYCCTIYGSTSPNLYAEGVWSTGSQSQNSPWPGTYGAGARVALVVDPTTSTSCTATQGGTTINVTASGLGGTAGLAALYMDRASAKYRYLFVVEIGS